MNTSHPEHPSAHSPLSRNLPFQRLVLTTFSNELSGALAAVALPLSTAALTGSAAQASAVMAASSAAFVLTQSFSGPWWTASRPGSCSDSPALCRPWPEPLSWCWL